VTRESLWTRKFTTALHASPSDPATPLLYSTGMNLAGLPPLCIHVGEIGRALIERCV
jgi:hypothetical protein